MCIGQNFFPGDGGEKTFLAGGRNKSRRPSAVGCGTIWAGQRIYHGVKWGQIIVTMREVGARQTVPHAQWSSGTAFSDPRYDHAEQGINHCYSVPNTSFLSRRSNGRKDSAISADRR